MILTHCLPCLFVCLVFVCASSWSQHPARQSVSLGQAPNPGYSPFGFPSSQMWAKPQFFGPASSWLTVRLLQLSLLLYGLAVYAQGQELPRRLAIFAKSSPFYFASSSEKTDVWQRVWAGLCSQQDCHCFEFSLGRSALGDEGWVRTLNTFEETCRSDSLVNGPLWSLSEFH